MTKKVYFPGSLVCSFVKKDKIPASPQIQTRLLYPTEHKERTVRLTISVPYVIWCIAFPDYYWPSKIYPGKGPPSVLCAGFFCAHFPPATRQTDVSLSADSDLGGLLRKSPPKNPENELCIASRLLQSVGWQRSEHVPCGHTPRALPSGTHPRKRTLHSVLPVTDDPIKYCHFFLGNHDC